MWDPQRYLAREAERARPFYDLIAHISAAAPSTVVDLGCGPGNLTTTLAERWPDADVIGVDSSAEMVRVARGLEGIEVVHADLREWQPQSPVDVLVVNAVLQWVPNHLDQLPRLTGWLAPQGWLAFQVPGNYREPAHVLLRELADSAVWRDQVGAHRVTRAGVCEPTDYLEVLAGLGLAADVWESTYLHVLEGEDAVLDWMTGTALRPVLAALDAEGSAAFLAQYRELLRAAYPRRPYGTILPFRRIFAVARRQP